MILDPTKQKIGFTSDYHLFHLNIILKLTKRSFKTVMEMNETIRDNHNKQFDNDSIIFNLGDAVLVPKIKKVPDPTIVAQVEDFLKTFKGKIYYLQGNHERQLHKIKKVWEEVPQLFEVTIQDGSHKQLIVLCHYCLRVWNKSHFNSWHLHGHSHGSLEDDNGNSMKDHKTSFSLDVGVDTNNFCAYEYEDIKKIMSTKTFIPVDHHRYK